MSRDRAGLFGTSDGFRRAFVFSLLLYALLQVGQINAYVATAAGFSTDDSMRLVQVRDFLLGQGWFDLVQHRVLPPDGLSMHWSRLVDLPMIALTLLLRPVLGLDAALMAMAAVWPMLQMLAFAGLVAYLAQRLFGWQAASFAVFAAVFVELLGGTRFGPGAIDHHGLQYIAMLAMTGFLVLPDAPRRNGALSGLAAALSLMIGLEMVLLIALAGIILALRHALVQRGAGTRLVAFCLMLGTAAPLLFLAQTDPALWARPYCDALALPMLSVTTAALMASLVLVAAGRLLRRPPARFLALAVTGVVTALVLLPQIQPCLAGPYTDLDRESQSAILSRILEIRSLGEHFFMSPVRFMVMAVPVLVTTAGALYMLAVTLRDGEQAPGASIATLSILAAALSLGTLLGFVQIRMMNMALPVLPLGFGVVAAWLLQPGHPPARRVIAPLFILSVLLIKMLMVLYILISTALGGEGLKGQSLGAACSTTAEIRRLDRIPPARIFNILNLGPMILQFTDHSVTGAPYHRSVDAFANGILPFEGDDAALHAAATRAGADYILVCQGDTYGTKDSAGSRLAEGQAGDWLNRVDLGPQTPLRLYRIIGSP